MKTFQIKPAYSPKKRRNVHRVLAYEEAGLYGVAGWRQALSREADPVAAQAIPKAFHSLWWMKEKPVEEALADYPANAYSRPACSRRLWGVISAFATPGMAWIQLPPSKEGVECEWGVVFGLPRASNAKSFATESSPHFFMVENEFGDESFFVSEKLKMALDSENLIGISYSDG